MFNKEEIQQWEQELFLKKVYHHQKKYFDPCKERYYKRFKSSKYKYQCGTESRYVKHQTKRAFRQKMKANIYNEAYYQPRPHDYYTYGWLTW